MNAVIYPHNTKCVKCGTLANQTYKYFVTKPRPPASVVCVRFCWQCLTVIVNTVEQTRTDLRRDLSDTEMTKIFNDFVAKKES